MTFPTKDSFTFNHADQPDYPQQPSTQTKANLDARGEELRVALNAIVDILNSSILGSSGAENIGVPETIIGSGITIKDRLEWIYSQLTGVALSEIPNGSVEDIKLANDVKIGSLATLTTSAKDSITNAINELDATDTTLQSNINAVNTSKIDLTQKGAANGLATLDSSSLVPISQIPTLSYIPKSIITAVGDLIIGMGANNPGILSKGTDGQLLTMVSGSPTWQTLVKSAQGNYTDTSTYITANGTFPVTIPMGINAQRGRLIITKALGTLGAIIFFGTNINDAISLWTSGSTSGFAFSGGQLTSFSGSSFSYTSNNDLNVQSVVISGSNLVITFVVSNYYPNSSHYYYTLRWEVEG